MLFEKSEEMDVCFFYFFSFSLDAGGCGVCVAGKPQTASVTRYFIF